MKVKRYGILSAVCCLCAGFLTMGFLPNMLGAAGYPDKPITLVVPMAPGGTTDLGARVLAEAMEKHLKVPVVVVNKPGGAMTIGGYAVASAKPDGYIGLPCRFRQYP
jgi:tripartite-type tricarboxylate transporter receptor subunit TctC